MPPAAAADTAATIDLILGEATSGDDLAGLLDMVCERLVAAGMPLWRLSLIMRAIDPTVRALAFVWRRGRGTLADRTPHGAADEGEAAFRRSPISHLQSKGLYRARWRLETGEGCDSFPLMADLRAEGATEYLIRLVPFGGPTGAALPGVAIAIATDRPGGLGTEEVAAFDALVPALGLASYRFALAGTASDLLGVYLGPMTAARVLGGEIRRGRGRAVTAAILVADLRDFTAFAGREEPHRVVHWLDEHLSSCGHDRAHWRVSQAEHASWPTPAPRPADQPRAWPSNGPDRGGSEPRIRRRTGGGCRQPRPAASTAGAGGQPGRPRRHPAGL
jgi:adenylate cyclase